MRLFATRRSKIVGGVAIGTVSFASGQWLLERHVQLIDVLLFVAILSLILWSLQPSRPGVTR